MTHLALLLGHGGDHALHIREALVPVAVARGRLLWRQRLDGGALRTGGPLLRLPLRLLLLLLQLCLLRRCTCTGSEVPSLQGSCCEWNVFCCLQDWDVLRMSCSEVLGRHSCVPRMTHGAPLSTRNPYRHWCDNGRHDQLQLTAGAVRTVFCCLAGAAAALSAVPSPPSRAALSSGLLQVRSNQKVSDLIDSATSSDIALFNNTGARHSTGAIHTASPSVLRLRLLPENRMLGAEAAAGGRLGVLDLTQVHVQVWQFAALSRSRIAHRVPMLMPAASLARSISRLPRYCSASTCSPFTASASLYLASAWPGIGLTQVNYPGRRDMHAVLNGQAAVLLSGSLM